MAQVEMILVSADRLAYLNAAADLATAADTMDRIANDDLETTPEITAARRGIYLGVLERFRAEQARFFALVDSRETPEATEAARTKVVR